MTIEATEGQGEPTPAEPKRTPRTRRSRRGGNPEVDATLGVLDDGKSPTVSADVSEIQAKMTAPENAQPPQTRTPAQHPQQQEEEAEQVPEMPDGREVKVISPSAARKLGASIGNKLPGAEHVEVWKRTENGALAYVGSYNAADLTQSQSLAAFLDRFVKGIFGPGDYQTFGITPEGKRLDGGVVRLLEPVKQSRSEPGERGTGGGDNRFADILQRQLERESARSARDRENVQPQDPIETLEKVHAFSQKVGGDKGEGTLAAIIQAMTMQNQSTTQLIVQMMQKSDERMTTLLTTLGRREPDPLLTALVTKLVDGGSSDKMPPMPPPPSPVSTMKELAETIALLREPPRPDTSAVLLEHLLKERMSPQEVLGLVNQVKGERGTDDFKKSMENLMALFESVQRVRERTEPSAASGFWGFAETLAGNRDLAGSVANAIRVRTGQARHVQQVQQPRMIQPPPQVRSLPAELQEKAIELHRRRLAVEEQKLQLEEQRLRGGIVTPPPIQPQPKLVAVPSPQVPAPAPAPAPVPAPAPPAQVAVGQRPLPPDIGDHVNNLLNATDDAGLVEATISLLFYLAELDEPWKNVGDTVLSFIEANDQAAAMQYVRALYNGLEGIGLIKADLVEKVCLAIESNFETIVEHIKEAVANSEGEDGDGDEAEEGAEGEAEEGEAADGAAAG